MKSLFKERVEIIINSALGMKKGFTMHDVAMWLNCNETTATPLLTKMWKAELIDRLGSARNTWYELESAFSQEIEKSLSICNGDQFAAVSKCIAAKFMDPDVKEVKEIKSSDGKIYKKIVKHDANTEQAINFLSTLIRENGDLKAEVELLKEEIENLKKYERYYKQIKEIKLC